MKYNVTVTANISFDTEVDTDELEEFTDEEQGNDPHDPNVVHDVLRDVFEDSDKMIDLLNESGFTIGRMDLQVEAIKEKK